MHISRSTVLEGLQLHGILFPAEALSLLGKGIASSTSLQFLSFKGCNIGDDGVHSLMEGLKTNSSIQHLDFSECQLTDKSGIRIGLLIKHLRAKRDTEEWQENLRRSGAHTYQKGSR